MDDEPETEVLSPQLEFLLLSPAERRQLLAEQAEQMVAHYQETAPERAEWQAGDFADED